MRRDNSFDVLMSLCCVTVFSVLTSWPSSQLGFSLYCFLFYFVHPCVLCCVITWPLSFFPSLVTVLISFPDYPPVYLVHLFSSSPCLFSHRFPCSPVLHHFLCFEVLVIPSLFFGWSVMVSPLQSCVPHVTYVTCVHCVPCVHPACVSSAFFVHDLFFCILFTRAPSLEC